MSGRNKEARPIARRFSAASSTYHPRAQVQSVVAGKLLEWAGPTHAPDRVLELGCGTGILTELLLHRFPDTVVDAVDAARGMVEEMRGRFPSDRVRCTMADVRTFRADRQYPLVVSNCAMHWIRPVAAGLRRLREFVGAGGEVLLSMMIEGTLRELHTVRLDVAPQKRPLALLPSEQAIRSGLEHSGLHVVGGRVETLGETHASAESFLASLNARGLTGGAVSTSGVSLTRGELRRLAGEYESRYRTAAGGVSASYEVFFVKAGA